MAVKGKAVQRSLEVIQDDSELRELLIGMQTQSEPEPCVRDSLLGVGRLVSSMRPIHTVGKK
eukprot:11461862-Prorocentrum_lima.AAC.1